MPKGMIPGGSRRMHAKIKRTADLAGKIAEVYRRAGMENNFTLWNTVADRHAEAASGLAARRKGARMDGGAKRKGVYKRSETMSDLSPVMKMLVSEAKAAPIRKVFGRRPPAPKVHRNSLGQAKPTGVKAFRMGNIRVLVGRDATGKTRINWGTVKKMIRGQTSSQLKAKFDRARAEIKPPPGRAGMQAIGMQHRLKVAAAYAGKRAKRRVDWDDKDLNARIRRFSGKKKEFMRYLNAEVGPFRGESERRRRAFQRYVDENDVSYKLKD